MESFQVKYLGAILTVLVSRFSEIVCAGCNTPVSTSGVLNVNQDVNAPSSKSGYSASAVFTTGWCANSPDDQVLEINFPNSHGIKGLVVKRVDQTNYPTRVLVKYVPNGGSQIQDIPLPNGLVLELNSTLTETTINFSVGIAVKRLQFTVTAFTGSTPCLKLELLGCPINELCPGGCMNGGACQMENACACPAGSSGTHCEIKDCTPVPLGLSNGVIPDSSVTVSSQDSHYTKDQIGNAQTNEGWCPSSADKAPWVEVKLSKPMAVSVFEFNFVKRHENDGGRAFIQEFDLHYISPLDSTKSCRSFASNITALNGTHYFTVMTSPVIVIDTVKIVPTAWELRACFKLELKGCDPTQLCSANFCLNGGTCMGENICQCPSGFVGTKCGTPINNIQQISLAFVNITNNILITATQSFQFQVHGNVHIQTVAGQKDPVISISGTNSYIQMNTTSVSCITDIAHCTSGFTFSVDVNFVQLLDNTYIINSGGHLPGHKGVALYYSHNKLYYIVSTSTLTWTLIVNYKPVLNVWQHFEITWNHNLGIEVLVNGHSLGTGGRPAPGSGTITLPLCVACSHTQTTVNVNMLVTGIISWTIDRNELVNAGVKPASLSSSCGSTTTTTIPTTTTGFSVNDAIVVGCSDIGWNIRVDISRLRQTLPGIRTSDIYLGENSCIGWEENGALYFRQGLRECLTSETIINDGMVYTNELVYAQHDPVYSFIIRQFNWTVAVECDVMNNESATGEYHHGIAKPSIAPVSGGGHHSLNLTFYQDANFLSPLPGNPIHLPTGTDVYVKVFTPSSDWTVKMHVHTCYTRPINALSDDQNYFLIRNGCEMDANTHILSQTAHETRFVFKDFVYTSDGAGINVKCDVTFCDSHDVSRQCTQTCN